LTVALTRGVSRSIERCELTHVAREPIDYARAVEQHDAYEAALAAQGCRLEQLPELPELPDAVFVEDAAVVFDDIAVIARPGAVSRRDEVPTVADALRKYRTLAFIEPPGTLDGGDVMLTARGVFVGLSARTNQEGARQLAAAVAPFGLRVTEVPVVKCLHLKTAVSVAGDDTLVANANWIDLSPFDAFQIIRVDPAEQPAANVLRLGNRVICASAFPRTRERLDSAGFATATVPASELAKAEGGLTCCSLIVLNS
jgi:dimethylargininase